MKVLFLDIDGVLNTSKTKERCLGFLGVDRRFAQKLLSWLEGKDIKIVLSSTWRTDPRMYDHLHEAGINWIDITPNFKGRPRGDEIKDWLSRHPEVTSYVILDDMPWMLPEQKDHFVQINENVGLQIKDLGMLDLKLRSVPIERDPST